MFTRRELLVFGLLATATPKTRTLGAFLNDLLGRLKGEPYYAQYTLRGLLTVASVSTKRHEQNDALGRVRTRMEEHGHDNLILSDTGVATYRSPTTLEQAMEHKTAIAKRGSAFYDALTRDIPLHKDIVTNHMAIIAILPEVRTSNDTATFDTIGTIIRPDIAVIQASGTAYTHTTPLLHGLLVHEADHLANHESTLLLLERRAYEREWESLRAYRERTGDESVNERIAHANKVVMRADYLDELDTAFRRLHPGVLDANALRNARIPTETLEKLSKRKRENAFDDELVTAIEEVLNPPKIDDDLVWTSAENPSTPTAPERIADYINGDAVKVL